MKKLALFILFVLLLTSCSSNPTAVQTVTLTPAPPTASPTPAPTNTPLPTQTPTSTPTIAWPVYHKTALPEIAYPVISTANLDHLRMIAQYASPEIYSCAPLLTGPNYVIVSASNGYWGIHRNSNEAKLLVNQPAFSKWSGRYYLNGKMGMSYSSDGKFFLGSVADNQFTIWDADGNKVFEKDTDPISTDTSASLSADGSLVAIANCNQFSEENKCNTEVINWKTGEVVKKIRGRYPIFSPDGQFLVVSFDKKIEFFSTADWKMAGFLGQSYYGSGPIQFSPSGKLFIYAINSVVEVYRTEDRKLIRSIRGKDYMDNYRDIAFSADEKRLMLVSYMSEHFLFDLSTGDLLSSGEEGIPDCFWLAEGDEIKQFYFDNYDWDVTSDWFTKFNQSFDLIRISQLEYYLQGDQKKFEFKETADAYRYEFYADGNLITTISGLKGNNVAGSNDTLALIQSNSGGPGYSKSQLIDQQTGKVLDKWDNYADNVTFGRDYLFFTTQPLTGMSYRSDQSLIIFDLESQTTLMEKKGIAGPLVVLEDRKLVGYFDDSGCLNFKKFGEEKAPEKLCFLPEQLTNHSEWIRAAVISPDGKLVAVGTSLSNAYFIDLETMTLVKTVRISNEDIGQIQFSHDGSMLMNAPQYYFGNISVWGIVPPGE